MLGGPRDEMTTTIEAPTRPASGPAPTPSTALVAVVKTRPATVLEDYARLMEAARWRDSLDLRQDTLIKLNLIVDQALSRLLDATVAARGHAAHGAGRRHGA